MNNIFCVCYILSLSKYIDHFSEKLYTPPKVSILIYILVVH